MMRPSVHENSEMPKDVFCWDGIDGTRILTYRILNCNYAVNGKENLDKTIKFYDEYVENLNHDMMLFYGVGNHGGGPTRADIEHLNSILHREGKPELEFSNPEKFFSEVLLDGADLPVWSDDLQHHASGCYSATSMIKQQNRRVENLLYGAEVFDTIASKFYGSDTEKEQLKEAWEKGSFNQFHDIMCGWSSMEAYEDASDSFGYASTVAQNVMNKATIKIARNIDTWVDGVSEPYSEVRHNSGHPEFAKPVVVFNPLSYDVSVPVRVYQKSRNVKDSEGNFILHQNIRSSLSNDSHQDTLFIADIPAFGYNTYWVDGSDETAKEITSEIKTENLTIENSFIKASFDKNSGGIIELVDKISGHE